MKRDKRSREIYRRRSERSSRATRERLEKRRKSAILEGENICS